MLRRVEFYQLNRKFVDSKDAPEQCKNLIYYSLAIGHHIGVLDCFRKIMGMGHDEYERWIAKFPPGEGRRKLEGVLKWGEIEITREHLPALSSALQAALPGMLPEEKRWARSLLQLLQMIRQEPAIYLVVRTS